MQTLLHDLNQEASYFLLKSLFAFVLTSVHLHNTAGLMDKCSKLYQEYNKSILMSLFINNKRGLFLFVFSLSSCHRIAIIGQYL